jgi:hypothetical protein
VFLNRRTAHLDLAAAGLALALARRSPLPLVALAPYARELRSHAHRFPDAGRSPASVAAADLAADLVGLAALAAGSARYRSPVL